MNQNPADYWTDQEKWVWDKITKGEPADFNGHPKGGGDLDPKNGATWPKFRKLTNRFLNDILFGKDDERKPYVDSIPRTGVRIGGAWFDEAIDISSGTIERRLRMTKTRFNGPVDFSHVIAKDYISLDGSNFAGELDFSTINIRTNLSIAGALFDKKVDLVGAKIRGQVDMSGSNFKQKLTMDRMKVTRDLFMNTYEYEKDGVAVKGDNAVFEGVVRLVGAQIGGQINMRSSNFKQELAMDGVKITGDLFMDKDEYEKDGVAVKGDNAVFEGVVSLVGAEIGGQVSMSGSKFGEELAMVGVHVSELIFHDLTLNGEMILFHAKVGVLMAAENSWPEEPGHVDLTGFTYERIKDGTGKAIGEIGWFDRMLKSQGHFTPQPYEQLAKVLMAEGYKEKAEDILFDKKKLERQQTKRYLRWAWMLLEEFIIGYGYWNSLTLVWAALFICAGTFFIFASHEACDKSVGWMLWYSVDRLIPMISINKSYLDVSWGNYLLQYYFYVHRIFGWILALFITAGLTGLTKKQGS